MSESSSASVIENKQRNEDEQVALEVAEASREVDWKSKSFIASIFMGELDLNLCDPFPLQSKEDAEVGDAFCAKVAAWAEVHIDGEKIDREKKIPKHVYEGMHKLGLFALKIPKEYGGCGLSQTNYMRVLAVVVRSCASCASLLSAHQSIGVPQPLKLFGTPEQKEKYFRRIAAGEISAFALTEFDVGSDPAKLGTEAKLSDDGKHWILNGLKLWCTNGVIADLYVVMARTPDKEIPGRKPQRQITAFIVEGKWEGVEVLHRCDFAGLRGIENGVIRFNQVKVPVENVVGEVGGGLKLALSTLNDGRLSIPAMSVSGSQEIVNFTNRWAKSRKQWGRAVGLHEPGGEKVSYINACAYAMDCLSQYCAALSDSNTVDIRMEAAAAKLWSTEECWNLIDKAIQLRGGRGYETKTSVDERGEAGFPFERAMRDMRVNRILEGTTEIMHLFLAREALDPHFEKAGPLLKRTSFGAKLSALVSCAVFYPLWYLGLWFGTLVSFVRPYPKFHSKLAGHLRWINRYSKSLARALFHRMVLKGPKLEFKHLTLSRIVDIGVELSILALVVTRTQRQIREGDQQNLALADYWLKHRKHYLDGLFHRLSHNTDEVSSKLSKEILKRSEDLPEADFSAIQSPQPREFGRDLLRTSN